MAEYRRTKEGGGGQQQVERRHRHQRHHGPGSIRSSMKERQDLRELDRELDKEDVLSFTQLPRHHLWHLTSISSLDPNEGRLLVSLGQLIPPSSLTDPHHLWHLISKRLTSIIVSYFPCCLG